MNKVKHTPRTTLPRRRTMEDVRSRPGKRWEALVTRSSWTLRGGRNARMTVVASEHAGRWSVTLPYAAVRARRHLLG